MTTLLAVDDSNTMRRVIEITFAGEDFDTVLAASADEAIERLYQASPEVALVDVSLGRDDGYELCQRIKGERPGTRVLLLSSKQHPYDAARAAAVGADDHMDKPFDTQSMIDKVRALVAAASKAVGQPAAPIRPAPAPVQPAPPHQSSPPTVASPTSSRDSEIPVLEPESPVLVEAEELEAITIEPPAKESAPPPQQIPAATAFGTSPPSAAPRAASAPPPSARTSAPAANGASMESRLVALGLTPEQVAGVLALSREVVEQAVWEVVPSLAETLIKEEIARLTK